MLTIKSFIEVFIFPPYAKFIFAISSQIKDKICDLIFYYLKNSHTHESFSFDNLEKIISFAKAFYANNQRGMDKIFESKNYNIIK